MQKYVRVISEILLNFADFVSDAVQCEFMKAELHYKLHLLAAIWNLIYSHV